MTKFYKPRISTKKLGDSSTRFVVEPLERGFGYTLGNTFRRVLLSSLTGAAITTIKVEGVPHEFAHIPGIKEDVTDVVLNLKELIVKSDSDEPATLKLKEKGPKEVKASDVKIPGDVKILNPELHIATLNKDGKLEMELTVEKGRGYVSQERNKKPGQSIGTIPIDSLFSPIRKVSYSVENTRVGQRTDYERLILDVETNESVTPFEAVSMAAQILNEHADLFAKQAALEEEESIFAPEEKEEDKTLSIPIEDLDLSVRAYNCLKRQKIDTLGELVACTEETLMSMRNFGAKSIKEVKSKLVELSLSLAS